MQPSPQAQKRLKKAIKRKLVDNELTVKALAATVGHDIAVVSKAINHGTYPRVVKKVKEALSV
jgi:hypothetical protein